MLDRLDMHIGNAGRFAREAGQLEVVRREQRESADLARDVGRTRPGERQSIEGARAAADFVHQNEAPLGCVVQDIRRLGHLQHERRATARQIVRGADAREDPIQRP